MRQLANVLTIARLVAAPILAALILGTRFREALALAILAGLTDWLDGWAARKLGSGPSGAILDPLADKILLVTAFVTLTMAGLIARPLLYLVIGRDLVIAAGALLLRIFRNVRRFAPSPLGKASTFFQIVFLLMVLLCSVFAHWLLLGLRTAALILTLLFTVLSGVDYVRRGVGMARLRSKTRSDGAREKSMIDGLEGGE